LIYFINDLRMDPVFLQSPRKKLVNPELLSGPKMAWAEYKKASGSFISELFFVQQVSTVLCSNCREESVTYEEPTSNLTLQLPSANNRCTLQVRNLIKSVNENGLYWTKRILLQFLQPPTKGCVAATYLVSASANHRAWFRAKVGNRNTPVSMRLQDLLFDDDSTYSIYTNFYSDDFMKLFFRFFVS